MLWVITSKNKGLVEGGGRGWRAHNFNDLQITTHIMIGDVLVASQQKSCLRLLFITGPLQLSKHFSETLRASNEMRFNFVDVLTFYTLKVEPAHR